MRTLSKNLKSFKVFENTVLEVFDGVEETPITVKKNLEVPETRVEEADDTSAESQSLCF